MIPALSYNKSFRFPVTRKQEMTFTHFVQFNKFLYKKLLKYYTLYDGMASTVTSRAIFFTISYRKDKTINIIKTSTKVEGDLVGLFFNFFILPSLFHRRTHSKASGFVYSFRRISDNHLVRFTITGDLLSNSPYFEDLKKDHSKHIIELTTSNTF